MKSNEGFFCQIEKTWQKWHLSALDTLLDGLGELRHQMSNIIDVDVMIPK